MFDHGKIRALAEELLPRMTEYRRYLHMHPEVSFEEKETAAYISAELTRLGIPHECGVGGAYGIVARIKGQQDGPCIAFRADFDALPVPELNDLPYASQSPGKMHACGHDSHTAMLLGLAEVLHAHPELFRGEARLIFQPAEETPPGGAKPMIDAGCIDGADRIYALHVSDELPAHTVGICSGPYFAASDSFRITISGKGGHGSRPHETSDTVSAACEAVTAINTIVSRRIPASESAVISVCNIHSDSDAYNVLPGSVTMVGTVRTYAAETANAIRGMIDQVVSGICASHGTDYQFSFDYGYPVVINAAEPVATVAKAAEAIGLPVQKIPVTMVGEDFSYYCQKIPGCLFRLGIRNEEMGCIYPLHNSRFNLDESAMASGLATFLSILLTEAGA